MYDATHFLYSCRFCSFLNPERDCSNFSALSQLEWKVYFREAIVFTVYFDFRKFESMRLDYALSHKTDKVTQTIKSPYIHCISSEQTRAEITVLIIFK